MLSCKKIFIFLFETLIILDTIYYLKKGTGNEWKKHELAFLGGDYPEVTYLPFFLKDFGREIFILL